MPCGLSLSCCAFRLGCWLKFIFYHCHICHPSRSRHAAEYCSRGSVFDVLRQASWDAGLAGQLTWRLRISMAYDAARGLLYLHMREPAIVHRDGEMGGMLSTQRMPRKLPPKHQGKSSSQAARTPTRPLHLPACSAVKSPNLLVDEYFHAKVADFNLSTILAGTQPGSSTLDEGGATNPRWLVGGEQLGGCSFGISCISVACLEAHSLGYVPCCAQ